MSDDEIEFTAPMGPDNFERGDRALKALAAYSSNLPLHIENEQELVETGKHAFNFAGMLPTPIEGSPISYLIADLCHVMRRHDLQVDEIVTNAIEHFGSDVIEQAWENDKEWHSHLQDESNLDRAKQVMEAAGVPEQYHDGAMKKSGIL